MPTRAPLTARTYSLLQRVSTATLTTQLLRRGFKRTFIGGLRPVHPELRLLGQAFTLRYVPAREDFGLDYDNYANPQRFAVETIESGEVLVIDARGNVDAASFGLILATRIAVRGAAGLVTDGALRDTPAFAQLQLPVYYRAPHATTSAVVHHPVDTNVPISCGEVLVLPGDVIVGDAEGVIAIPRAIVDEVAEVAMDQELYESFALEKIQGGSSIRGIYPPENEAVREYDLWRATRSRERAELEE